MILSQDEFKDLKADLVQLEKQLEQLKFKLKEKVMSLNFLRKKQEVKLEVLTEDITNVKYESQKSFNALKPFAIKK